MTSAKAVTRCEGTKATHAKTTINIKAHQSMKATARHKSKTRCESKSKYECNKRN